MDYYFIELEMFRCVDERKFIVKVNQSFRSVNRIPEVAHAID
jgi:hypothetical protein